MTAEPTKEDSSEFERRTRALLLQSADELSGALRSRLTQARHAALAAHPARPPSLALRWLPAGAAVAAMLALLIMYVPLGKSTMENPVTNAGFEDIEMLTDTDTVPLNGDQEVDYDFYEWAAAEAGDGGAAPAVGS
jgi:ferric-dicitrate binding protein FerR (iron transport regulator)